MGNSLSFGYSFTKVHVNKRQSSHYSYPLKLNYNSRTDRLKKRKNVLVVIFSINLYQLYQYHTFFVIQYFRIAHNTLFAIQIFQSEIVLWAIRNLLNSQQR